MTIPTYRVPRFISLVDLVRAVAQGIAIPDYEIDQVRSLNRQSEDSPETEVERRRLSWCHSFARAANVLLRLLEGAGRKRPKWIKYIERTEIRCDDFAIEGIKLLVEWSKKFELREDVYPTRLYLDQPEFSIGHFLYQPRPGADIGFNQSEIIRFLDSAKVPHLLGQPTEKRPGPKRNNDSSKTRKPRPGKNPFTGPLADLIWKAQKQADDPDDYKLVFESFCRIALGDGGSLPRPIYSVVNGEVKYVPGGWDGKSDPLEIKIFTCDNMRSRSYFRANTRRVRMSPVDQ